MQDGYILVPMGRSYVNDMRLCGTPDRMLAVLPVLIAHENETTRMCWPSIARIATLAGVGKDTAHRALKDIEVMGWMKSGKHQGKNAYQMLYRAYSYDADSIDFIRIDRRVITEGLWACFPASAKRLYIVMRALSLMGHRYDDTYINDTEDCTCVSTDCYFAFLPAFHLEPRLLRDLTGLNDRTFRYARQWLLDNDIAQVSDEAEGLILPFDPKRYSPTVLKRLEAIKEDQKSRPKGGALRSYRGMKKAATKQRNKSKRLSCDRQS